MRFSLPDGVNRIITGLESAGFAAHIVGGSVRDLLRGRAPDDYDIATSATPEEIKRTFANERTVDTGIKHGTVSVILGGSAYEVTTYRIDGEYKDSRHPDSVCFTRNIEEDLSRRDFTVNAIAYSHSSGVIDPFGGRADIEARIIRAVGDPDTRFSEDALRILRGIRFSSTLGFEIEESTAAALRRKKQLLSNVSAERIYTELKKMLSGDFAYRVISDYSDLLLTVIPSLDRITLPVEEAFSEADYHTRLFSIFYLSSADPVAALDSALRKLRTDSFVRESGLAVLSSVGKYDLMSDKGLNYMLKDIGIERSQMLLRLEIALGNTGVSTLDRLRSLINSGICYRVGDLCIDGRDILALGVSGREVGLLLDRLLCAVIEGRAENGRGSLLEYAKLLKNGIF